MALAQYHVASDLLKQHLSKRSNPIGRCGRRNFCPALYISGLRIDLNYYSMRLTRGARAQTLFDILMNMNSSVWYH